MRLLNTPELEEASILAGFRVKQCLCGTLVNYDVIEKNLHHGWDCDKCLELLKKSGMKYSKFTEYRKIAQGLREALLVMGENGSRSNERMAVNSGLKAIEDIINTGVL